MPVHPLRRGGALLLAVALLGIGAYRLAPAPRPAAAVVGHLAGYRATVDGFTSWYGSYDLGALGPAWCVDHAIRAPDPALAYVPTDLPDAPDDVRAALAWAIGRNGPAADQITAAALMLVAHDLMGATYPSGRLDVDRLTPARLTGFGADGAAVLDRAGSIKADALAHAHLRPPWLLEATADDPAPGQPGNLVVRLSAGGVPVAGVEVRIGTTGTAILGPGAEGPAVTLLTGTEGTAVVGFVAGEGPYGLRVDGTLPDLQLQAFAPTAARAQRVARAAVVPVAAAVDRVGVAPTTTSTSTTSTTSTSTTTTSTVAPTTTTTPSTLAPTTSTSAAPITTAPAPPPTLPAEVVTTAPAPPPTPRSLPRTGADPFALGCVGSGLVLVGTSIRPRRRSGRPPAAA